MVSPIDLFNPSKPKVSEEEADKRYSVCESCEHLSKMKTCNFCHCFMKLKTTLAEAECPIGKWGKINQPENP